MCKGQGETGGRGMSREISIVKARLDILYVKIVVAYWSRRNHGLCELCRKQKAVEVHHIFGRGYSVRWIIGCGSHVCKVCHNKAKSEKWFILGMYAGIRGIEWYKRWSEKAKETKKWILPELIEKECEFNVMLRQWENVE